MQAEKLSEIQTERLRLRKLALSDAAFTLQLLNDPSYIENIADRGVRTMEEAEQYLRKGPLRSYEENGFGLLMIVEATSQLPLGMCGLIKRANLEHTDIGFALLPQFWGQGFAYEAAAAVASHAKTEFHHKRLLGVTNPENLASIRLLKKLGMSEEGTVLMNGETKPILLFGRDL